MLENKAVSGSRGLSSDIALWLLISARTAQAGVIRQHSLPVLLLLTVNPLKSIYGLIDIMYLTSDLAFQLEVWCL